MKNILFIMSVLFFASCSMKKNMSVKIKNNNTYPISFTIKTINISKTFSHIKPNESFISDYDWTTLNHENGEFLIVVENENTKTSETFHHGQIVNGELGNYFDAETQASNLKIVISD